jgi:hypothetical protein
MSEIPITRSLHAGSLEQGPLFYAVRDGHTGHWTGDRKQTTLWQIDKPRVSETGHSTQKPVECMRRPIENNSSPGQAVYEPFSGSGTTIIAAEMTARVAHAIEITPAYVDVAVKRWQDFTGQQAVLDGDGRSFDRRPAVGVGERGRSLALPRRRLLGRRLLRLVHRQQVLAVALDHLRVAVAAGDLVVAHRIPLAGDGVRVQRVELPLVQLVRR